MYNYTRRENNWLVQRIDTEIEKKKTPCEKICVHTVKWIVWKKKLRPDFNNNIIIIKTKINIKYVFFLNP